MNIISKPNIFFTSDFHLFHQNILKLGKGRPFETVDDMHAAIADRHNAVVRPGDIVYNLGDYALKTQWEAAYRFRQRLLGNHYFIIGNHDSVAKAMIQNAPDCFVWARYFETLRLKGYGVPSITICHFALRTWPNSHRGSWQLYGHSHSHLPELDNLLAFDVGVDCWDFTPVSIEQVTRKMKSKMPAWEASRALLTGTERAE